MRFKTISAQKQYKPEIESCFSWLSNLLENIDLSVQRWETSYHPCLFAQNLKAGKDKPTVLLYLHYDVQPVDPLNLWDSPPFEPTIKGDLIFARGACDNKGQAFYTLSALRSIFKKEGRYPVNLKIIIEGEEEVGSKGLTEVLSKYKKELQADYFLIVDADTPDENKPAVCIGFRGIYTFELTLKGSRSDLHSGLYGGIVYNPIQALCEILSKFHDANGAVTIPGFYDDVRTLSKEEKDQLYLDFDQKAFEKEHNTLPLGGEKEFSPLERMGLRPTFEINGIWGGYIDEGFKTVIPSMAHAKASMRLVPNQNPVKIKKQFEEFIHTLVPKGLKLSLTDHGMAHAMWAEFDSKIAQIASLAMSEVFQKPCKKYIGGGSLPIAYAIKNISGAETLALGLGLSTDQVHAPNEHFSISRLKKGYLMITSLLEKLGEL